MSSTYSSTWTLTAASKSPSATGSAVASPSSSSAFSRPSTRRPAIASIGALESTPTTEPCGADRLEQLGDVEARAAADVEDALARCGRERRRAPARAGGGRRAFRRRPRAAWRSPRRTRAGPRRARLAPRSPPRLGSRSAAMTSTGIPLRTALPEGTSTSTRGEQVRVDARRGPEATPSRAPGASWPQPCGIETTPGMISSVTSTGDDELAGVEYTRAWPPSARPRRSASVGVDLDRAAVLALTKAGRLCIQELLERSWRRPISTMSPLRWVPSSASRRGTSATTCSGASSILPDGGAQYLGDARSHRAEVEPVWVRLEALEGEPVGVGAEPVAEGPDAQHEVDRRSGPRRSPSAARISSGDRPSIGDPASATSRPIRVRTTSSSNGSMSASGPWPAAIAASRSMTSHSAGWPSSASMTGGDQLATLRMASW